MCGIIGFPELTNCPALETAEKMLLAVAHRGPEGMSTLQWKGMVLGHCQLSFVDHETGRQPIISCSQRSAIVFNGEIYNYRKLRRRLIAEGVQFRTEGDTEVALSVYERYGVDGLKQLQGMFAVAIWDAHANELVLARDPCGKKPLYYFEDAHGIVFASELHALLRHPACPRGINHYGLADYLMLRVCPAPDSMIEGVKKVPAGAALRFHKTRCEVLPCWMPPPLAAPESNGRQIDGSRAPGSRVTLTDRFGKFLRRAVTRRLSTTDLEFGVLLSGGIDSAVIAALAARQSSRKLKTFSIGFEQDPVHDETPSARAVANHLGTDHIVIRLPAKGLADIAAHAYGELDEPIADPSFLPTYLVCAEARRHVRGVLTGDGADELLLGYRYFQVEHTLAVLERAAPGVALRVVKLLARATASADAHRPARYALGLLARGLETDSGYRFYAGHAPFAVNELRNLFDADVWAGLANWVPFAHLRAFFADRPELGGLERAQASVMFHFLRDVILTKVDRASMRHALEARCPFLDTDLVHFASELPLSLKLHGLTSKYILRNLASRYLPQSVVRRTKQGFRSPVGPLLSGELRSLLEDMLAPSELEKHCLFNVGYVERIRKEHVEGQRDRSRQLWTLLCFQLWWKAQANAGSGTTQFNGQRLAVGS
jgi:asparagine synthase (glutamine-hydrolysing)